MSDNWIVGNLQSAFNTWNDKIVFIENKTNYDEYLISELEPDTLAVYHGGFLSPQKRKLFSKIQSAIPGDAQTFFWADIDLGGFQMFSRLRDIIPNLQPIRMTGEDVITHSHNGLKRSEKYLKRLDQVLSEKKYPMFPGQDLPRRIPGDHRLRQGAPGPRFHHKTRQPILIQNWLSCFVPESPWYQRIQQKWLSLLVG